jgi:hypothetical protein
LLGGEEHRTSGSAASSSPLGPGFMKMPDNLRCGVCLQCRRWQGRVHGEAQGMKRLHGGFNGARLMHRWVGAVQYCMKARMPQRRLVVKSEER